MRWCQIVFLPVLNDVSWHYGGNSLYVAFWRWLSHMVHVPIQHIHVIYQGTVLRKLVLVKRWWTDHILISIYKLVLIIYILIKNVVRVHHLWLLIIIALIDIALHILKWYLLLVHVQIWSINEIWRHCVLILYMIILTSIKLGKLESLKVIIAHCIGG